MSETTPVTPVKEQPEKEPMNVVTIVLYAVVGVIILVFLIVTVFKDARSAIRDTFSSKQFGGEYTTINVRRDFNNNTVNFIIDDISKRCENPSIANRLAGKYMNDEHRKIHQCVEEYKKLVFEHARRKGDNAAKRWKELYLPIIEAVTVSKINRGTYISPVKVLGSGSFNVAFLLYDRRVLRVFKYCKKISNYKQARVIIDRTKSMFKEMKNIECFPQIYDGSHRYGHEDTLDNPTVAWMIVKCYQPITYKLVKNNLNNYYNSMMEMVRVLHKHKLAYADWKIINMMWDPDTNNFVLTDIDFELLDNSEGATMTHAVPNTVWNNLQDNREALDIHVIKKEMIAASKVTGTNERRDDDAYWKSVHTPMTIGTVRITFDSLRLNLISS